MHQRKLNRRLLLLLLTAVGAICLFINTPSATSGPGDGAVRGKVKILDRGPDAISFNIVLLAEGYTGAELTKFAADAESFVNVLLTTPPFDSPDLRINVYRVDVASTQSGADVPLTCGGRSCGQAMQVATYFDAKFCGDGLICRLLVVKKSTAMNVLNSQVPNWNLGIVVVNSSIYGGSGGVDISVTSTTRGWEKLVLHELGHSAFGLADEYEYYQGCTVDTDRDHHPPSEPIEPNVTIATSRADLKWKDLVLPTTPIPTLRNENCAVCEPQDSPYPPETVGTFEGAHYYHCDAFRPQFNCLMRRLWAGFCAVCRKRILDVLFPYVKRPASTMFVPISPPSERSSSGQMECIGSKVHLPPRSQEHTTS